VPGGTNTHLRQPTVQRDFRGCWFCSKSAAEILPQVALGLDGAFFKQETYAANLSFVRPTMFAEADG
jgi:hypothetical protein